MTYYVVSTPMLPSGTDGSLTVCTATLTIFFTLYALLTVGPCGATWVNVCGIWLDAANAN
jgi:Flp pilus assembly protein protease CpaA